MKRFKRMWTSFICVLFKRNRKDKKYSEYNDKDFYDFILKARDEKIPDNSIFVLKESLDSGLSFEISKVVGFDVSGFKNIIEPSEIRHIIKEHGENGTSDRSMRDLHDLEKISYVIENWDRVELGKGSKKYKNRDNSKAKTIVIQKKIEDNYYYVVEAVPNNARKNIYVVSAYINKNDTLSNVVVHKP